MIKLEVNLSGASQDDLRRLEELMQKVVLSLAPHMNGVEVEVKPSLSADPYTKTKQRILDHIRYRQVSTSVCLTSEFWEIDIQDYLNPKERRELYPALSALCEEGYLEEGYDPRTYYLSDKGFDAIY
ncbi:MULTISPECIES: hypothetical protein [Burkholderia cepacia complex]|uniref:hypothetical protein n=1 Tax=Burkholderia cepacia complex TaxID=87882 RepID=UPI0012D8E71D|nr:MULTISPECIES: hypothetical protein [Burkholderia cepacia complex]